MTDNQKPHHPTDTPYANAQRLARDGKYVEAIDVFDQIININNGFAEAYFERGVCSYKIGQYHRATDDINAATVLGCETAQMWSRYQMVARHDPYIDSTNP